jgi:DNA-binding phage protein
MKGAIMEIDLQKEMDDNEDLIFDSFKIKVIEKIKEMMDKKKINKSQLGKRSGLSRAYITRLMKGQLNPTIKSVYKIANVLGCDLIIEFK